MCKVIVNNDYNILIMNNKYLSLFIILTITFLASAIGGFTTSAFKEPWYSSIIKPTFNPPDWVFAPIWIFLYLTIAFAAWLIWLSPKNTEKILKIFFIIFYFCIFNFTIKSIINYVSFFIKIYSAICASITFFYKYIINNQ